MSNVGQDVEHIWSCLQIRRCGSFPLVWSEFGGAERRRHNLASRVYRAMQAAKIHEYISHQTLMTFWIKANIPQSLPASQNLAAWNVEEKNSELNHYCLIWPRNLRKLKGLRKLAKPRDAKL